MTRLEMLLAAGVLVAICALSMAPSGYADLFVAEAAADPSPLAYLLPLQRYSFHIAAVAVTLLALLLEDGRRRSLAERGSARPESGRPRP